MSSTLILIIIALYFCLLFGISWIAGRKADNAGFFSGNRSSNWLLVAMSTIGAPISAVTFVSVPGMVEGSGFSYMQMVLGFTVGQLIIAFVLIPLYYKMNLTSIYEYLNQRFGIASYKTGAWFFFLSKSTGAAVRLFIVCSVLQLLVFNAVGVPFLLNVLLTMLVVYLCTFRGGVRSVVWTDLLKTTCLLLSIILCIFFVLQGGIDFSQVVHDLFGTANAQSNSQIVNSPIVKSTRIFFFDDVNSPLYFWKQFIAGIFVLVATTGLDQDMMQRTLSCRNYRDSQKNIIVGAIVQMIVIYLFLVLGYLLYTYAHTTGISLEGLKGDDVFPFLATGGYFPIIVGVLFVLGFIAAGNSAAGSALTALTTSFTIDILGYTPNTQANSQIVNGQIVKSEASIRRVRTYVHIGMAILMATLIYVVYLLNNESVINTVYRVASYTYGPLLGMFFFGILTKRQVMDKAVPVIAILSPILTLILDLHSAEWFGGYTFSHERLLLNALFTALGMYLCSRPAKKA